MKIIFLLATTVLARINSSPGTVPLKPIKEYFASKEKEGKKKKRNILGKNGGEQFE